MKSNRFVSLLVAVLLLAPSLFAAEDLTGKWSGSFMVSINGSEAREDYAYMVFKHAGKELTGTAGPNENQQWPILKGVVSVTGTAPKESTKASFDVASEGGAGPTIHFELELVSGRLKGAGKAEQDGNTMTATLDLARVK